MTSSRYCSPSTQLSFTPVEGCCDPCAGMRMSSCSCCPSVSGCSCGPQNQQMSKLAAFALGGNGCCEPVKSCRISAPQPPPYFSCPPPIRPRNVGAAACSPPPAFICSGPARGNSCGKTPSERLKNVDVLEELCYYVPGQCCPPVDCYNVCNCCGESEMLNCCCNGSSCPPPPPNPVKYSRRQRFAFQNERPQPQPQPSWPFDPMETCPCPPDPCQQRPPQRFCEKKPAPRPDPCGSNSRMPSQTGLYYFDRRRKIFIPENELPLPSRCVTQASRSRSAAPRKPQRQETFEPNGTNDTQNCPPYEEIEIIEDCANEEDQQQQVIIQPVIQPVIMPNPNCNQSNNNNCNPCCNPNPCNPCCNPNPCNPCCNPPNPCNPFCNPNPCNPCCNPFMGMGNPCGPCMPMCMPMCPPPPPQQMMGPPPMNPLMAMLMNPKLMKKMNKHRKKSKSRKHHRHHRKTKETVIDYDSNGYPDEYDHDRSQQNSRSRSTKSGGRHTGSGSGGRGAEQDADHRDGDGRHKPNADHRDGDGRHKPNADHRDGDGRHKPTPRQNSRGANNSRNAENPQSSQKSRPPTYSSKGHSSNIIVPGKPGEFFGNAGPPSTAYEETLGTEMNAQSTNGPENTLSYAEVRLPKGTTTHQVNLTANTQDPNHHHAAEVGVIQGPEANAGMKQTAGLAPAFVETTPQGETAEYYFIPEGQDAKVLVDNKKP